ncbi:LppU/SCO3897 family protein [Saccharopolyspora sp. NPDC002376]
MPQQPMPPQGWAPQQPMQQPMPPQGGYPGGPPPQLPQGGFGPPPMPPPQKSSASTMKVLKIVGTVVLGIVVIGGGALLKNIDGGGIPVGDCVDITNASTTRLKWDTATCGTPESDYKVAEQHDGRATCADEYASVEKRGDYVLCMVPDVKVGDCTDDPISSIAVKLECSDPKAELEVTTVVNDSTGDPACTDDADHYQSWNEPALTVCWKSI